MKYIIGIDSGATSSETITFPFHASKKENRGIQKKFPPINFNVLGFEESAKRLINIVKITSKKVGLKNVSSIAAGISGARYEKDWKKLERAVTKSTGFKNITVLPDTEIAFASVFEPKDKNCGILIAGTGSILYYRDSSGKLIKIGGWGRHIGDEGSGHWIAREALYNVTRYYDGREKKTLLIKVLKKEFGIVSSNIVHEIYHNNFEISKLAKYVFSAAEKGDKISKYIIKIAAENLLTHFIPLKNKKCRVALLGSLFSKETILEKNLRKLVKEKFRNIELVKPKQNPVWGAVKIAISHCERSEAIS